MKHTPEERLDRLTEGVGLCNLLGALIGVATLGVASGAANIAMGAKASSDAASSAREIRRQRRRALLLNIERRGEDRTQAVGAGLGHLAAGGLDVSSGAGGAGDQVRAAEAVAASRDVAVMRQNFLAGIADLNARTREAKSRATASMVSGGFQMFSAPLNAYAMYKGIG